jgi:pyruvate dehydrogenase E2 component (dihydrolipoamide acetyltransferase)
MPKLSDSMSEAVIVTWLKRPGDEFVRGEPLVEVETDKATVVYEAECDGLLAEILVDEGNAAALGEPIARLGGGDGEHAALAPAAPVALVAPAVEIPAPPTAAPRAGGAPARPRATPVARRTAAQFDVSLHDLIGTGPGGRIRKRDVLRAGSTNGAPDASAPKGPTTIMPLSPTGATIARRMVQSRSEIPSFDVSIEVDVTTVLELRRGVAELLEIVPSVNDFFVKALALTLREFPAFNSSFVDGHVERHGRVNVGIAVATDDSLLVPAVTDADRKPLAAIAAEIRSLAARAAERALSPDELTTATFTVSNLGMFGVRSFNAVINPPQVAILAVGSARRSPVESGSGGVVFRDLATVTLTSDHRVIYGADAARFLGYLRSLLEHPLAIFLQEPGR